MMNLIAGQRGQMIRQKARELGFDDIGFAEAQYLEEEAAFYEQWLDYGHHAGMDYMARNREKRYDPRLLVDGTKSVVLVLQNYKPDRDVHQASDFKLAKYAYGRDYHKVLKNRLKKLMSFIQSDVAEEAEGRFFVDSAPVSERSLAARAGLGWRGKNTNLIHPRLGSFVFIGEIFLNIELPYGEPIKEACGGCTRCLDACPTGALTNPYQLDANRCISYLTIENKGEISEEFEGQFEGWVFGCDICQDVCPWNWKARPHKEADFNLRPAFRDMTNEDWRSLDASLFDKLSQGSSIRRAGFDGLMRNIRFVDSAQK
jgi:epoxyqueuosine reductase